jgi:glycosyltransferase involved in cell wall biosynthesis
LPEAGGPDSLYIDPGDPEALTDAIIKILDDSDLRERMIKSGYEYAIQNFNEKQTTHQVMDCYLSTLKG